MTFINGHNVQAGRQKVYNNGLKVYHPFLALTTAHYSGRARRYAWRGRLFFKTALLAQTYADLWLDRLQSWCRQKEGDHGTKSISEQTED